MIFDDYTDEDRPPIDRCKHCGSEDVEWIWTGVRWRLFGDGGKPHVCEVTTDGLDPL